MNKTYRLSEVKLSYRTRLNPSNRVKINCPADCYKLLLNHWDKGQMEHKESFKIILLNQSHTVLGIYHVSDGGISDTTVDVRLILQAAILSNASSLVLAHNHTSGNLKPSHNDSISTIRIKQAAALMGIKVYDHLIVCKDNYYSFANEGAL